MFLNFGIYMSFPGTKSTQCFSSSSLIFFNYLLSVYLLIKNCLMFKVFVKLCNGFAIVPLPNDNQSQSQPSSSANPENLNYYHLHNMTLLKPAITQWSYFQISYHPGSLIRMKVQFEFERVENASIEINIFFTFGDVLPSAISHDFMLRVHEKATKKILIRPNSKYKQIFKS